MGDERNCTASRRAKWSSESAWWNDRVNPRDKMIHYLVFFVIAVLYWPRVWTQVLYAVLEWIFNYQNNGGRHGTGKMPSHLPHDLSLEILCVGEEGERKGRILSHWSLKKSKEQQRKPKPQSFGDCSLCPRGSWRELRGVSASLLWVGGIALCTVAHLVHGDRAYVLFLLWVGVKSFALQFFVMQK